MALCPRVLTVFHAPGSGLGCARPARASREILAGAERLIPHLLHRTLLFFLRSFFSRNSEARHQEGPGYWDLRPAVCRELTTQVTSSVRGPGLLPLIIVPNRLTSDVASLINTYPLLINRHSVSFPRKHCVFLFIKCQAERVASRRTTRTAHLYAAVRFCQAPL